MKSILKVLSDSYLDFEKCCYELNLEKWMAFIAGGLVSLTLVLLALVRSGAVDAASVLGLTDPRLCYMLDGFLFIYAVVMTALFVKAKLSQPPEPQLRPGQDDVYNKLSRTHRDDYDVLGGKRGADPELGGRHQQRRKNPQDTVYTALQKDKMGEAYSEIGMKGEGLSAATKDTYDALQMQPLPPR
ncbi:T-cell surface glycoprotein CD3 zeta chain [Lonchura striata]|uniref:T-cell surface glycoprotein CD3 zeta chain n=1 Tax=Lonchura striata TaxID=40157 RepID=A0A218V275_9PASE|nr:T-cell surface glycoprotein CD3 zeta chain [Lonchura striata domestica]